MSFTPADASLRGRIGAHALHAQHDSRELTEAARAAANAKLDGRLLRDIDPSGALPEGERRRRLGHARRAYFLELALRSVRARRERKSLEAVGDA